jgi:CDP-4-dehydro-6-deoxyglucose reductase
MTTELPCLISSISYLNPRVLRLVVTPKTPFAFSPGQYVYVRLQDERFPFSIANGVPNSDHLEFFISLSGAINVSLLLSAFCNQKPIFISKAMGHLTPERLQARSLIFIAAGTGIAPVKSLLEALDNQADKRAKQLYWAIRSQRDLYLQEEFEQLLQDGKNLRINVICKDDPACKLPLGEQIVYNHNKTLKRSELILAGPFARMLELKDFFMKHGLTENQLFSDAFDHGGAA